MSAAMQARQSALEGMLARAPVVAVVVVERLADAVPLARALLAGGVLAIEVTLRTEPALAAIAAIANEIEHAIVGAGTVLTAQDLLAAEAAGAQFAVSPGSTPRMLAVAAECDLPWLPGASTASEAMQLFEHGYRLQKLFPAAAVGGENLLRSLSGPLPAIRFCPTGGITRANANAYLKLPNVICVGGSWLTPNDLVRAGDWKAIEALARDSAGLRTTA